MNQKGKKSKTLTTCVYCGSEEPCTEEHVLPRCLFPETGMPLKSEFVIVPACKSCNKNKGCDDSYVRDLLVADVACENNPTVMALLPAVVRSAEKNWSHFARVASSESRIEAVYSPSDLYSGHHLGVPIDWKRLERYFSLVVRGLCWHRFKERLPDNYVFEVHRLHEADAAVISHDLINHGGQDPFVIGSDVFSAHFTIHPDNRFITCWLVHFYQSISFSITTGPTSYFDQCEAPTSKSKHFGFW